MASRVIVADQPKWRASSRHAWYGDDAAGQRRGAVQRDAEDDEAAQGLRICAPRRHAVADHDLPGLEADESGHCLACG